MTGARASTSLETVDTDRLATTRILELVAHRAGNDPLRCVDAATVAHLVEIDVHWHRGRIEARHAKRLWGTRRLWDRWYLLPADAPRPTLHDVLDALGPDTHVFLDLKGWSRKLAAAVREAVAGRPHVTVSTKSWWLLRGFDGAPGVRTLASCGSRARIELLRRVRLPRSVHGVVVHQRLLSPTVVRELAARGPVFSWAVADRPRADQLVAWGVTGIIIDELELIGELRAAGVHVLPDQV